MSDSRLHHRRFFVPGERIREGWVEFTSAQAHQLTEVLRLRPGDQVSVFDGTGREIIAILAAAMRRRATARILGEAPALASPRLAVTLAQVVPRGAAMDLIVAKATELGVARIVPLEGERSVRRTSARAPRWLRIAQEAAEQCGRKDVPEVAAACTVVDFLHGHGRDTPLVACEAGEGSRPLPAVCQELQGPATLTLLVGGEGGLSPGEMERLRSLGAHLGSLGPRLLRTDTAALAALAVIQACLGDWEVRPGGETDGRSVS
ncbi:MAG: 16S rRNA (uracil(1498)-N(3))-methyltransferase [candidate division NC10 bacterium]|nr:16S rRNA (uracil(1498)-N(3))-methyltransferase [candidate division NC10 bacterium]